MSRPSSRSSRLRSPSKQLPQGGRQLQQASARSIFQKINLTARSLVDRADSLTHVPLIRLARPVAVDVDPNERLARKRTDQGVALPLREQVTSVDHQGAR